MLRLHSPQEAKPDEPLQEVVVTGSRIIQSSANSQQPLSIIDRDAIDRTGLASIGELLQQVTTGGKALNAKFNSSGNFGYPPTVAVSVPVRRRSTCAAWVPSACWCWSTASVG